jgi:hypothetical protein
MEEELEHKGDPNDCPACRLSRQARQREADETTENLDCEHKTRGIPLPEEANVFRAHVPDTTWNRIGTDTETWLLGTDEDQQVGDVVTLHDTDNELWAAGIIKHVAHAGKHYQGLRKGYVIITLHQIRPARTTEPSE